MQKQHACSVSIWESSILSLKSLYFLRFNSLINKRIRPSSKTPSRRTDQPIELHIITHIYYITDHTQSIHTYILNYSLRETDFPNFKKSIKTFKIFKNLHITLISQSISILIITFRYERNISTFYVFDLFYVLERDTPIDNIHT